MTNPNHSSCIERGTLYYGGVFDYRRIEARQINFQIGPDAQFDQAIKLTYTQKSRRKSSSKVFTDGQLVILAGWGHPAPPRLWSDGSPLEPISTDWGTVTATIMHPRYPMGDKRWITEFNKFLDAYLRESGTEMLLDFRNHDFKDQFRSGKKGQ